MPMPSHGSVSERLRNELKRLGLEGRTKLELSVVAFSAARSGYLYNFSRAFFAETLPAINSLAQKQAR